MTLLIIILVLLLYILITVVRYGKGVLFPNFHRVNRRMSETTGIHFMDPFHGIVFWGRFATTFYFPHL